MWVAGVAAAHPHRHLQPGQLSSDGHLSALGLLWRQWQGARQVRGWWVPIWVELWLKTILFLLGGGGYIISLGPKTFHLLFWQVAGTYRGRRLAGGERCWGPDAFHGCRASGWTLAFLFRYFIPTPEGQPWLCRPAYWQGQHEGDWWA